MQAAADEMVGRHDFAAFRAADCQSPTSQREIHRVDVQRDLRRISITIEGSGFLKYMARIMVGTLVETGNGQLGPSLIPELLESGDRGEAGITAPPDGLTLIRVHYPDDPWRGGEPAIGGAYLVDD